MSSASMRLRSALCATGLFVLLCSTAFATPPTVVVGAKNLQELIDDADNLGASVGQNGLADLFENTIKGLTGGIGLAGVDRERPFGLYWSMSQVDANDPGTFVGFVPVTDADEFENLVKQFATEFHKDDDWTMTLNGIPVFAKISNDYCFISTSESGLEDLEDPQTLIGGEYDIELDLNLSGIPDQFKQVFLASVESQAQKNDAASPPPTSEAEENGRQLGMEWTMAAIKLITNDGERLTFGVDVDSEARLATVDVSLSSQDGTSLAKAMGVYAATTPAFGGIEADDAPLRLILSHPTTALLEKIDLAFDTLRKTTEAEIDKDPKMKDDEDRKAAKDVANRLFTIAEETLKSGSLHSILLLDEGEEETLQIVAATKVANGNSAAKLLDDILTLAKETPDLAQVKVDVDKHAGTRIHAIETDAHDKKEEMFGSDPIHLGFRADSLWFAVGGGNLSSLKDAITAASKKVPKTEPPISLRVRPATLVTLLETDNQALLDRAEKLAGSEGDVLNLEIIPDNEKSIKIHLEFGIDLFQLGGNN